MFELYLAPADPGHEAHFSEVVSTHGGRLDYREAPEVNGCHNVCLTYEFDSLADAEAAARQIRSLGEHVEGPYRYG